MASKIATKVLSGLGVATLATLSLFTGNTVSQNTGTDLSNKANEQSSKQQLACHNRNHSCGSTSVGGVRG